MQEKSRYIGSVRFYKNMLLIAISLLVVALASVAIYYHHQYEQTAAQLNESPVIEANTVLSIDSDPVVYQALYEDFYAPEEYNATNRVSGIAYLTFDGGPSEHTSALLELLAQEDVKATFFVTGNVAGDPQYAAQLRAIVAEGHTLGMGSWSSDYAYVYSSVEAYLSDMYVLYSHIVEATGVKPSVFRFVGGSINSYNAGIYRELIAEMIRRGFVPYDWNLSAGSAGDTSLLSTEELVLQVSDGLAGLDRAILLLHDDASHITTTEALPGIIALLRERGFSLSPLSPDVKPVLFAYTN